VCRAITDLQQRGVITLAGKRTVKILNRGALEDRAGEKLKGLNRLPSSRLAA
jgi:CRP/FNR family transcriptional regulator, nitrogen fixation regulation protein